MRREGCGALALGLALALGASADETGAERLDEGHFLLSDARSPPREGDPRWEAVALPDTWRGRRPPNGVGWYRLALPEGLAGEGLAVLLPSLNMNAEVFVNGTRIGSGGRVEEPAARNANRPLYFALPGPLLREEENRLDIRLIAYHFGSLGPVWVGPEARLLPRYQRQVWLQVHLALAGSVVTLLLVLSEGSLWWATRRRPEYGSFCLVALFWMLPSVNYWLSEIPVATPVWTRAVAASCIGFGFALPFWAHRLYALRRRRAERALLAVGAILALGLTAVPESRLFDLVHAGYALALAAGTYAVATLLLGWPLLRQPERMAFPVGGLAGVAFATNDLTIQLGLRGQESVQLMAYAAPVLLLIVGSTRLVRFVGALRESEALGAQLEERVRAKAGELEAAHARRGALERERAVAGERERLMREMHDGVGGSLVSMVVLAERGRATPSDLAAQARRALAEMRLVIDSLDPGARDLDTLLGQLRARLEPQLEGQGVRFAWRPGVVAPLSLSPERSLHVLRIVQEAITNSLRHAKPRIIDLETAERAGAAGRAGVAVRIRDDGLGLSPGTRRGHGLANMAARAAELRGTLGVAATAAGTEVTLWFPRSDPACASGALSLPDPVGQG